MPSPGLGPSVFRGPRVNASLGSSHGLGLEEVVLSHGPGPISTGTRPASASLPGHKGCSSLHRRHACDRIPLGAKIVAAVRASSSTALLDVGGALGTYTVAFLQAVPGMTATLFDRPEVIEIARPFLEGAGLLHRVRLAPGDFYEDELPGGHDLAFVSAIIHQNSPEQNLALFSKVFRSLDPGGRIIIRDHVMEPDRTRPKDGAVFAVNMFVATAGGNTYTFEEIKEGLVQAGFADIRLLQSGEHMDGLVEAFRP